MPSPTRTGVPGALFHTIARGNGGQKTFLDEQDYQEFVDAQARKVTAVRQEFVMKAVMAGTATFDGRAFPRCSPSAITKIIARSE